MRPSSFTKTLLKASFAFVFSCVAYTGVISQHVFAETTAQGETQTQTVTKLSVDAKALKMKTGKSQQLVLTATYSDKTTADVTKLADWSSSDNEFATVDAGLVTAVASGKPKVTASYKGKKVTIPVEIDIVSQLKVKQSKLALRLGASQTLTLTATYTDKSTADVTANAEWNTADSAIAKVEKGVITAVGSGKTKITVKHAGKTLTIPVEVDTISKMEVSSKALSLRKGVSQQLTLNVTYSDKSKADATENAEWSTADSAIATVDKGAVTAVGAGKTKITVKYGGKSLTIPVEVDTITKLEVTPKKLFLRPGGTQQLVLTATYADKTKTDVTVNAEWSTADSTIATVDKGAVTAVGSGKTKISIKYGGKTVSVDVESLVVSKLTVEPTRVTLKVGETKAVAAKVTYTDKTTEVVTDKAVWTSADNAVATVSGGVITAQKAGKTSIITVYAGKIVKVNVEVK